MPQTRKETEPLTERIGVRVTAGEKARLREDAALTFEHLGTPAARANVVLGHGGSGSEGGKGCDDDLFHEKKLLVCIDEMNRQAGENPAVVGHSRGDAARDNADIWGEASWIERRDQLVLSLP